MSKDPAFLFYSSDFLTGTMFMTNEQIGLYIRMLCAQHQHGGRIDTNVLRTQCESITNGNVVFQKFKHDERGSYNERLEIEAQKRRDKSLKAAESVKSRWNKTKKTTSNNSEYERNTNVIRSENENENENENINDNENKDKNGVETKFDAKDALLKMGVDSNLADEWLKVRKHKKRINTRTAFLKIWREIKKTELTANDCIKAAIEHSWGGFEADWLTNSTFAKKGHKNDESSLTNPEVYKNIKFT
jgi:uncharacterized protein YdaU (DUF1376 family)